MKCTIAETVYGYFALNEDGLIIETSIPTQQTDLILEFSSTLVSSEDGVVPQSVLDMISRLIQDGYEEIQIESPEWMKYLTSKGIAKIQLIENSPTLKSFRENFFSVIETQAISFPVQKEKISEYLKEISETILKYKVAEHSEQRDIHIKKAVETIVDINKSLNLLMARLREWYGLHFPEITTSTIPDGALYAALIKRFGSRDQWNEDVLISEFKFQPEFAKKLVERSRRSMGGNFSPIDIGKIQQLATKIVDLYAEKANIEQYLENTLKEVAPNITYIIGPSLAGSLIALAGSLEKLSKMPSSTIQIIGAEKALFKSLKYGLDTPKHGVIFQWHKIRAAKYFQRGHIARLLAGKLAICAKVDYFKGAFIADKIAEDIERKINAIKTRITKPPEVKKKGQTSENQKGQAQGQEKHAKHNKQAGRPHFDKKEKQKGKRDKTFSYTKSKSQRGGGN